MTASILTLRSGPDERLDLSGILPSTLAASTEAEIARLPVGTTRHGPVLGDLFDIRIGDGALLVYEGGSPRFDRLGAGLDDGAIRVVGDVGQLAGRGMTGGRLDIDGAAGPLAGSGMMGGRIEVVGDAGDDLGGPMPGEMAGMRGGEIVVQGDAGARAGDRMRRGTIVVAGSAGACAGCRMIAGTLMVGGSCGAGAGQLMRRGTIVLVSETGLPSATFVDNGAAELVFLRLLHRLSPSLPPLPPAMRRLAGDMAVLGRGEILMPIG